MSTAFVLGNGESRKIFPIEKLKGAGTIYGCNAIYRDNPDLCDSIISVNPEMTEELLQASSDNKINSNTKIYGKDNLPEFSYILESDPKNDKYRFWSGTNLKTNTSRKLDLSVARGSGCSAIQVACNDNHENIFIIGFDMLGAGQYELRDGALSRLQNNMYKNTVNYPDRINMKAYLKFEWSYQLRQLARSYPDKNFYYINRSEYLEANWLLHRHTSDVENFNYGIYADLMKWLTDDQSKISWRKY